MTDTEAKAPTDTLIARLESADGPSRELDAMIQHRIASGVGCGAAQDAPRYTASIDAALTLVPDGWNWMAGNRNQPIARAYVENGQMAFVGLGGMKRNPDRQWFECVASTPALALAAAALKARGV